MPLLAAALVAGCGPRAAAVPPRPLADVERNPVRPPATAGGLVRFFGHPPRVRAA